MLEISKKKGLFLILIILISFGTAVYGETNYIAESSGSFWGTPFGDLAQWQFDLSEEGHYAWISPEAPLEENPNTKIPTVHLQNKNNSFEQIICQDANLGLTVAIDSSNVYFTLPVTDSYPSLDPCNPGMVEETYWQIFSSPITSTSSLPSEGREFRQITFDRFGYYATDIKNNVADLEEKSGIIYYNGIAISPPELYCKAPSISPNGEIIYQALDSYNPFDNYRKWRLISNRRGTLMGPQPYAWQYDQLAAKINSKGDLLTLDHHWSFFIDLGYSVTKRVPEEPISWGQANITGHVYDGSNNNPVAWASIEGAGRKTHSLNDGSFKLEALSPGDYSFNVSKEGYSSATINTTIPQGSSNRVIIVALWPELPTDAPEVLDVRSRYCSKSKPVYFLDGVDLDLAFEADVHWPNNRVGTIRFITPQGTYEGSETKRTFNVGQEFGEGGTLTVVAIDKDDPSKESNPFVVNFKVIPPPPVFDLFADILYKPVSTDNNLEYRVNWLSNIQFDLATWDATKVEGGFPVFGGQEMKIGLELEKEPGPFGGTLSGAVSGDGTAKLFTLGWEKKHKKTIRKGIRCRKGIKLPYLEVKPNASLEFNLHWDDSFENWIPGGIVGLGCDFKGSTIQIPLVPVWGIPTYTRGELTLSLDLEVGLNGWSEGSPEWSGNFEFEPLIKGILGAGIAKKVCVEGYLGGGFHSGVEFLPALEWHDPNIFIVIGAQAVIGPFKFGPLEFKHSWPDTPQSQMISVAQLLQGPGYSLMSRDYLSYNVEFVQALSQQSIQAQSAQIEEPIAVGVYPYSVAECVSMDNGNNIIAVWIADDTQRSLINRTELVFANYSNGSWSVSQSVADDQTADLYPQLISLADGNAACIWQNSDSVLSDNIDVSSFLSHIELSASIYNSSTQSWSSPKQITNNSIIDSSAKIAGLSGDNLLAVWISNESNDIWGSSLKPNKIMWSAFNGSSWSNPIEFATGIGTILGTALAYNGSTGTFVFCVDTDDDLDTHTDQELFYATYSDSSWSPLTQLTNDSTIDASPHLLYDSNGTLWLTWLKGDDIRITQGIDINNSLIATTPGGSMGSKDYDFVIGQNGQKALIWSDISSTYSDIWSVYYDSAAAKWGKPKQLTSDDSAEKFVCGTFDINGDLFCIYDKTETVYENREVTFNGQTVTVEDLPQTGRTDLYYLSYQPDIDLAVTAEDVNIIPPNPHPGTQATISAKIDNKGYGAAFDVEVAFYDGDPDANGILIDSIQTISQPISGGGNNTVSVSWTVPESNSPQEIFAVIDPNNSQQDSDQTNNTASIIATRPDLAIQKVDSQLIGSEKYAIVIRIANEGAIGVNDVNVTLHEFEPNGPVIASFIVDELHPGNVVDKTFEWDLSGIVFEQPWLNIFALTDPNNQIDEFDEDNNIGSTRIQVFAVGNALIDPIEPSFGPPGTRLRLEGSGFGPKQGKVSFGAVVDWNDNVILVDIPTITDPGIYKVFATRSDGWSSEEVDFEVIDSAEFIYVSKSGNDIWNGSISFPFPTIQKGINAVKDGETVTVQPGEYTEIIDFLGKAITVQSTDPYNPSIVSSTILIGSTYLNGSRRDVVTFENNEDQTSVLSGLTIKNGRYGIKCDKASPTITHNNIIENSMAGIYCKYSTAKIINNIIAKHKGTYSAEGIDCSNSWGVEIRHNTIVDNDIGIRGSSGTGNQAVNCIIWANKESLQRCSAAYSCVEGGAQGEGNISKYPYFADSNLGDYHLLSYSPCINKGDPNFTSSLGEVDIDRDDRILFGITDMGADEANNISTDSDDDGLPDLWEIQYLSSLVYGPDDDSDNDGWSNFWEYHHGFDPNKANMTNRVENITKSKIYEKIEYAINEASDGDIIVVSPGIYHEVVDFSGKAITLRSLDPNDSGIVETTVIKGNKLGSGLGQPTNLVTFRNNEGPNSVLEGFTITHEVERDYYVDGYEEGGGRGIYCGNGTSPTIRKNIIRNNYLTRLDDYGAGIYCYRSSPLIIDNIIINNISGQKGGGIYCESGSPVIQDCYIAHNSTGGIGEYGGAGMLCDYSYCPYTESPIGGGLCILGNEAKVLNNVIEHNYAKRHQYMVFMEIEPPSPEEPPGMMEEDHYSPGLGGGIYVAGDSEITGNTIVRNQTTEGNGMYNSDAAGGGIYASGSASIKANLIKENTSDSIGGGVYCGKYEVVSNNLISDNYAYKGAGIFINSDAVIQNNTLENNLSKSTYNNSSQAIYCNRWGKPKPVIKNNVIAGSTVGLYAYSNSTPIVQYNAFWNNVNDIGGDTVVSVGDIHADPLFADEDMHLLPSSPCIDAGDPNSDYSNEPLPNGERINIGCYGNTSEATTSRNGLKFAGFTIINKTRVGRTTFRYDLSLSLTNTTNENINNIHVRIKEASDQVTAVIDPSIIFPLIQANSTVKSDYYADYFQVIVDRSHSITPGTLTWQVDYTVSNTPQTQVITTSVEPTNTITGDITGDGKVNIEDLRILAIQWLQAPGVPSADIAPIPNGDDIVNFLDFAKFAENWSNTN